MKAEYVSELHRSRKENPRLTVFDTGEMLEPALERETVTGEDRARKTGVVEFTDDSSVPILQLSAFPSQLHDDTVVLQVDTMGLADEKLMVVVNDGPAICHFSPETEEPPMVATKNVVREQIVRAASSGGSPWEALAAIAEAVGIPVARDDEGKAWPGACASDVIAVGDTVALTGDDWRVFGLQNQHVVITDIDHDGDLRFADPRAGMYGELAIFTMGDTDYSATLVRKSFED